MPGDAVGELVVERRLSAAGLGVVYRATDPAGKQVTVKVILAKHAGDPEMVVRFIAEARTTTSTLGFGQLPDGRYYYVMDLPA